MKTMLSEELMYEKDGEIYVRANVSVPIRAEVEHLLVIAGFMFLLGGWAWMMASAVMWAWRHL